MNKIEEYVILYHTNVLDLSFEVDRFMKMGWIPHGSLLATLSDSGGYEYFQAVIKVAQD